MRLLLEEHFIPFSRGGECLMHEQEPLEPNSDEVENLCAYLREMEDLADKQCGKHNETELGAEEDTTLDEGDMA